MGVPSFLYKDQLTAITWTSVPGNSVSYYVINQVILGGVYTQQGNLTSSIINHNQENALFSIAKKYLVKHS